MATVDIKPFYGFIIIFLLKLENLMGLGITYSFLIYNQLLMDYQVAR